MRCENAMMGCETSRAETSRAEPSRAEPALSASACVRVCSNSLFRFCRAGSESSGGGGSSSAPAKLTKRTLVSYLKTFGENVHFLDAKTDKGAVDAEAGAVSGFVLLTNEKMIESILTIPKKIVAGKVLLFSKPDEGEALRWFDEKVRGRRGVGRWWGWQ